MLAFDFAIIDIEHGPNSVQTVLDLIRTAEVTGLAPIVRVKENNISIIGELLDIGAVGVKVPKVNTPECARRIIQTAKFSPLGERGMCRFVRAAGYLHRTNSGIFKRQTKLWLLYTLRNKKGLPDLLT